MRTCRRGASCARFVTALFLIAGIRSMGLDGSLTGARPMIGLLPNHLHEHLLRPAAVEFAVKDLLPGAEVELAGGDGDDDFAAHDLPLEMGVGVGIACTVGPTPGE